MDRNTDRAVMALILSGALLAVLAAIFLPALHVRDADRTLLSVSSWEAVPVITLLKFVALLMAIAAHLMPNLQHLRLPLSVAAVAMLFVPALAALMAGVSPGTDARAILVQRSGTASPWVDPGWGILVLMAAGTLIGFGLWKEEHSARPASPPPLSR
jgi:hypothetical protein